MSDTISAQLPPVHKTLWNTEADTAGFAQQLAQSPALANATITLEGDLGAGKTTFVRHLLGALGVSGRIKSPTYAIVEPHTGLLIAQALAIAHFDFYRFEDEREWEDAGFRDQFAATGLKLVEWPTRVRHLMPMADMHMHITWQGLNGPVCDTLEQRVVTLTALSACGAQLLQQVARA
ncbi:tRNA (adenosine(37)-N6)-threonylcarbamoyltransferase complex ATPase subunit type 1 TsaE [Comamonadaceae bacterium M7527]|nr:tRNA (adenosine(37)-N6)-threonylcarbamoyltransferase complex ATPase subunit type 1 TsaE [Comamonadaceae bacterium M7527]